MKTIKIKDIEIKISAEELRRVVIIY